MRPRVGTKFVLLFVLLLNIQNRTRKILPSLLFRALCSQFKIPIRSFFFNTLLWLIGFSRGVLMSRSRPSILFSFLSPESLCFRLALELGCAIPSILGVFRAAKGVVAVAAENAREEAKWHTESNGCPLCEEATLGAGQTLFIHSHSAPCIWLIQKLPSPVIKLLVSVFVFDQNYP